MTTLEQCTNREPTQPAWEWTVEGAAIWNETQPIGIARSAMEAKQIADAHNAALAAELEKRYLHQMDNSSLREQLAAEREKKS